MNLEKRSNEIKARITEIKGLIGAEVTLEVLEQLEAEVDEFAFISMEGVSILEYSTLAVLSVPRMIKNALEVLCKGEEKKDE